MMTTAQNSALAAGRILAASIFILSGLTKIGAYAGTAAYMESVGVPGALLPAAIAFEIGVGLALAAGLFTRLAAASLAAFSIVTAVLFHANFADQMQTILFLKNISMAGGLVAFAAVGGGAYALDRFVPARLGGTRAQLSHA